MSAPDAPSLDPSLDPLQRGAALEAMAALAQAWREGEPALADWTRQHAASILWRWGWHSPQEAMDLAALAGGSQQPQAQACAGFALMGAWEARGVDVPLDFEMWTEWEGDSYHPMANVQWEISTRKDAQTWDPGLISCARAAFEALGEAACEAEEWYEGNDERSEDCSALEFFGDRLPDARVPLAAKGFEPGCASLLLSAVERQALSSGEPEARRAQSARL